MVSSPSKRFIKEALEITGDQALSYIHTGLKWLISDHLVDLIDNFPALFPGRDIFVHDDGTSVNLLHVLGSLPLNSAIGRTPPPSVLVTIWLHQAYPFKGPLVFVSTPSPDVKIVYGHPHVDFTSGVTITPYLEQWKYPSSNLVGLARDLVKIFSSRHPYNFMKKDKSISSSSNNNNNSSRDTMVQKLVAKLQQDKANLRTEVDALLNLQSILGERAKDMERGVEELRQEQGQLESALKKKTREFGRMMNWLQMHACLFLDEAEEGFETADERSRCLLENSAAEQGIEDLLYALGKALEKGVVSFEVYIKQVRVLTREQFFYKALVKKALEQ